MANCRRRRCGCVHLDIAEVETAEGKLCLFAAIDRKFRRCLHSLDSLSFAALIQSLRRRADLEQTDTD
jgi:hypothetical protein